MVGSLGLGFANRAIVTTQISQIPSFRCSFLEIVADPPRLGFPSAFQARLCFPSALDQRPPARYISTYSSSHFNSSKLEVIMESDLQFISPRPRNSRACDKCRSRKSRCLPDKKSSGREPCRRYPSHRKSMINPVNYAKQEIQVC